MVGQRLSKLINSILMIVNLFEIFCKVRIHFGKIHSKTVNKVIAVTTLSFILILQIVLSPSVNLLQNVEAALPVSEITSKKYSRNNNEYPFLTSIVLYGAAKTTVHFDYRGFDDNDRVLELRCSWDGINYAKSNCNSESAESQSTFTGPDGITRTYNVKTGSALRELTPSPNLYTFGVKMLNSNLQLSEPTVLKFVIHQSTSTGPSPNNQAPPPPPTFVDKIVKVQFDSITITDDHDGFGVRPATCCSGEWSLIAFVQRQPIHLLADKSVDDRDPDNNVGYYTLQFPKDNPISIPMYQNENQPLSIFTYGIESDVGITTPGFCGSVIEHRWEGDELKKWQRTWIDQVGHIFYFNPSEWYDKIEKFIKNYDTCPDQDKLGHINEIYPSPQLGAGEHTVPSTNGDFTLKYSVSVEPVEMKKANIQGSIIADPGMKLSESNKK